MEILWHWPPENSWGRDWRHRRIDANRFENFVDPGPDPFVVGFLGPDVEAPADDVANPAARVERRDRVLEDHLEPGPHLPQVLAHEGGQLGLPVGARVEDHPT